MNKKEENQAPEQPQTTTKKSWQTPEIMLLPREVIKGVADSGPDAGDMLS